VAEAFPDTKFAIVDGFIDGKDNVSSLLFTEQDGSFLVGMIAGMKAQEDGKNTVGFVGGMDIPLIHRFEAGYKAGVEYVCADCTILSDYAGSTPSAFADPVKGKELALAQIDKGAYVIYHASGLTGAGVYEAGKEREVFVIGVDSNQNHLGHVPATGDNFGLTSMLKQVDVAVYLTIKSIIEDNFQAGPRTFGLADSIQIGDDVYRGVYYALDEYNEDLVTQAMIDNVTEAEQKNHCRRHRGSVRVTTSAPAQNAQSAQGFPRYPGSDDDASNPGRRIALHDSRRAERNNRFCGVPDSSQKSRLRVSGC
jgi:basic membrane protein A and related proteins